MTIGRRLGDSPWLAATASMLLAALCGAAAAATGIGPTVRDVVEFPRLIQPLGNGPEELRALASPDGRRAFIVTRRADVTSDRNFFEIQMLDLNPRRLTSGRWLPPRTLLTVPASKDESYAEPSVDQVRWRGNRDLVFIARLGDARAQVYRLDVFSGRLRQLTREKHPIASFDVSRDMQRVLYAVQLPNPPLREGKHSVVVGNQSFWAVKFGQQDLRSQDRVYRYFVADRGGRRPSRALGEAFAERNHSEPAVSLSPDGRWALLPRYEPERQAAWAQQYPLVADAGRYGNSATEDPMSYFSRPSGYVVRRMQAWRLRDGHVQTVLDAPDDAQPGGGQRRSDRLWQGDGRSVVLAGTYLPASEGGSAKGSHIVEYWPDSGRWVVIASLAGRLGQAHAVREGHFVAMDDDRRREFVRRADGQWQETGSAKESHMSWTLRLAESLDGPPQLMAAAMDGRTVQLTRLAPQFDAQTWGDTKSYDWQDAKGRTWEGGLMVPSGLVAGGRHPLVIQTYGFEPDRFYLDGPAVGFTSAFAGRAFLREGILVLALPWAPSTIKPRDEREAVTAFMDGVLGAVGALTQQGLVDPARVGIIGWSATGERVLNLVTFSDLPVRAATMADGDANTLFSTTVTYGADVSLWVRAERLNHGLPFGPSLDRWVRGDPSLHTDCVKTALRIETYGPWVLNNWDLYSLLRRQYKPAEMVVIPGGTHSLSRPSERMVSLQGNVDWFRFWLRGEARDVVEVPGETAETLKAQYESWRQMEALRQADEARPRCAASDAAR